MKRRPRVLHVVRQYRPSVGGLEEYVNQLVTRQAQTSRIVVLTLDRLFGSRTKLKRIERVENAIVIRVPFVGFHRFFVPFVTPRMFRRFDVIHLHALDQLTDLVSFYRKWGIPPLIATSHGLIFHTPALHRFKQIYFSTISRWTLTRVKKIFAVSRNDQAKLSQIGIASEVLPNPIEPFPWLYQGSRHLIYWGRIAENKSVERLIPFFAHLKKKADDDRLLFIVGGGSADNTDRLVESVRSLNMMGHVRRYDYLNRSDLAKLLAGCGYTVSASRYEGYGMVQVEGMSAGLLPVMHHNTAFTELAEASTCGLLLDFSNPERAAEDFLAWEARLTGRERQRARGFALKCSWPPAADRIEASYRDVMARRV